MKGLYNSFELCHSLLNTGDMIMMTDLDWEAVLFLQEESLRMDGYLSEDEYIAMIAEEYESLQTMETEHKSYG